MFERFLKPKLIPADSAAFRSQGAALTRCPDIHVAQSAYDAITSVLSGRYAAAIAPFPMSRLRALPE